MEKRCCVPGCSGHSGHVDVHPIPAQEKEKWLLKINETSLLAGGSRAVNEDVLTGVCSLHFICGDFVYSVGQDLVIKKDLSAGAIPSIFPWSGENWENVIINKSLMELTNSSSIYCNNDEISDELFQGGEEIGNVESLGIGQDEEESAVITSSMIPNTLENSENLSSSANNPETLPVSIVIKKEASVQQYQPLQFYRCKHHSCTYKTSFEAKFKRHNQEKHPRSRKGRLAIPLGNRRLTCSYCGFITTTKQNLEKHELLHNSQNNPFQCSNCSYSVKTQTHLVTHMKRVHPELETHNDLNLIQPQPANDDQATNTISEGTTQPQQNQGLKRKKKPGRIVVEKLVELSVYHCNYCSFWSKTLSLFHDHVLSHSKTPAFRCSTCSQGSKSRPSIQKHINQKRKMDFEHYYARCVRSVSPPRDQYVANFRPTLVPQKTQCGRFSATTQDIGRATTPSSSNTGDTYAIEDSDDTRLPNATSEPASVALADSIQQVALESNWENMLASDNCAVLTEFLHTLERTKINENELEEESKLCRDQLSFLGEKIKLPYGLMREARQDHDISLLKIPDLHLKVEEEREKLQQLADEIKQVSEKEERLNTLLEEIKANQYHVDRKERLFAQMDVFEAQKAKCSYQLDENVEEGTSLEEMDEEISKAQEKLEVVLQQLKEIQLKRDQLEVELRDVTAAKDGLLELKTMTESDFAALDAELNAVLELKSSADERLKQMIAATQVRIRIYSVLEERLNRICIIDKRERWLATLKRYNPTEVDLTSIKRTDET